MDSEKNNRKRRNIGKLDKKEIGLKCCNCHSVKNLEYHHIIPFALGGNDINSNMCCLCHNCHNALHNSNHSYFNNIKLYNEQRPIGRPRTTASDIPQIFKEKFKLYKQGQINFSHLAKECNITRATAYKYKNIIEGDKGF